MEKKKETGPPQSTKDQKESIHKLKWELNEEDKAFLRSRNVSPD